MKKTFKFTLMIMLFVTSYISTMVEARTISGDKNQISRYETVSNKPPASMANLLSQKIQMHFPQNIETVGDAIKHVLRYSGYNLISDSKMNSATRLTLQNSLPLIHREIGPLSLKDTLLTLIGPAFYIVHDPVNRIVDFRLKPAYRSIFFKTT